MPMVASTARTRTKIILAPASKTGEEMKKMETTWKEMVKLVVKNPQFVTWLEKPHNFPIKEGVWHDQFGVVVTQFGFTGYADMYCVSKVKRYSYDPKEIKKRRYFSKPKVLLKYLEKEGLLYDFLSHYDSVFEW